MKIISRPQKLALCKLPACVLTILTIVAFAACTKKIYVPTVRTHQIIDTVTRIEADSATLQALFDCDSLGRVRMNELSAYKGRQAQQQIDFEAGRLKIETRWRTQYIERLQEIRDTITVVEYRTEIKQVRHVPKFFLWTLAIAIISVLYTIWRLFFRK